LPIQGEQARDADCRVIHPNTAALTMAKICMHTVMKPGSGYKFMGFTIECRRLSGEYRAENQ
jgi:hypothetical protein